MNKIVKTVFLWSISIIGCISINLNAASSSSTSSLSSYNPQFPNPYAQTDCEATVRAHPQFMSKMLRGQKPKFSEYCYRAQQPFSPTLKQELYKAVIRVVTENMTITPCYDPTYWLYNHPGLLNRLSKGIIPETLDTHVCSQYIVALYKHDKDNFFKVAATTLAPLLAYIPAEGSCSSCSLTQQPITLSASPEQPKK